MDVNGEVKFFVKIQVELGGQGVRVELNEELKFL